MAELANIEAGNYKIKISQRDPYPAWIDVRIGPRGGSYFEQTEFSMRPEEFYQMVSAFDMAKRFALDTAGDKELWK